MVKPVKCVFTRLNKGLDMSVFVVTGNRNQVKICGLGGYISITEYLFAISGSKPNRPLDYHTFRECNALPSGPGVT